MSVSNAPVKHTIRNGTSMGWIGWPAMRAVEAGLAWIIPTPSCSAADLRPPTSPTARPIPGSVAPPAVTPWGRPGARDSLLGHCLARAAERLREVLELGQAVLHRQHGLGVIDVQGRIEVERRDRGGIDVDQAEGRMIGHEMAAAFGAVLSAAGLGLHEAGDVLRTLGDLHVLGLPEREGVHRAGRPGAAGAAVAVAHGLRCAGHLNRDGAAEAVDGMLVGHFPRSLMESSPVGTMPPGGLSEARLRQEATMPGAEGKSSRSHIAASNAVSTVSFRCRAQPTKVPPSSALSRSRAARSGA